MESVLINHRRFLGAIALAAAAGLALAGCSGNSGSGASSGSTPFNIYFDAGLTGSLSANAKAQEAAIQAAVDSLNSSGGILGHKIKLTVSDDGGDPTKALTLFTQYLNDTTPDLVIPGQTSDQALALLPTLTRNQILSIGLPNSSKINDPKTYPYAFATNTQNKNDATALAKVLTQQGFKSIGFIASNDALGEDVTSTYSKVIEAAGIKVTVEQFNDSDADFTAHLQRVQQAKPDAIVLAAFGPAVGYTLKARQQLGITSPLVLSTVTSDGIDLGRVSSASQWSGVTQHILKVNTPSFQENAGYTKLTSALGKEGVKPTQVREQYTFAWDQVYLAAYAAEQAKSVKGPDMAKALEDFKTPSGSLLITFATPGYSATNHFLDTSDSDYTYQKAGAAVDGVVTPQG